MIVSPLLFMRRAATKEAPAMKMFFSIMAVLFLAGCGNLTPDQSPLVSLSASPERGNPPLDVTFSVATYDPDGTVVKMEIDFDGDGVYDLDITGVAAVPYTYDLPDIYVVTVRATDDDGLTTTATIEVIVANSGDEVKTLPFPSGVTEIRDITFDAATGDFWPLETQGSTPSIFRVSRSTGTVREVILLTDPIFSVDTLNEIALVLGNFQLTTGALASDLYTANPSGAFLGGVQCPSTSTGFCRGLAWDGTYLWSGASDSTDMAAFDFTGTVQRVVPAPALVEDVDYDSSRGHLLVTTSASQNLYRIDPLTGGIAETIPVGTLNKGTWDGELFWFVDNVSREFKGVYIN